MKIKSIVLSIFLIHLFIMQKSSAWAQGFMPVANVSKISGSAFVNKEKIKVGAEIAEGMDVSIPKKGDYIEVKFQNGHIVRLVGAHVLVTTLNPKNTFFELLKGKIFSVIKPLTPNETFDVKTKRASFGVRGTQFFIEEDKSQTYLCVCEGVVSAKSGSGQIEVHKDEDVTIAPKRELKATLAAKSMIGMAKAVFKDMK